MEISFQIRTPYLIIWTRSNDDKKKTEIKKKNREKFKKNLLPFFCYLVYRERNHAFRAIRLEQSPHNGRG